MTVSSVSVHGERCTLSLYYASRLGQFLFLAFFVFFHCYSHSCGHLTHPRFTLRVGVLAVSYLSCCVIICWMIVLVGRCFIAPAENSQLARLDNGELHQGICCLVPHKTAVR